MKKIICLVLAMLLFSTSVCAFNFPEPDWGALFNEKMKYNIDDKDYAKYIVSQAAEAMDCTVTLDGATRTVYVNK